MESINTQLKEVERLQIESKECMDLGLYTKAQFNQRAILSIYKSLGQSTPYSQIATNLETTLTQLNIQTEALLKKCIAIID